MSSVFLKTFGGLSKRYYFRQLFFGGVMAALFILQSLDPQPGHDRNYGLAAWALANFFLYPYSRFVYEGVVGFILGDNFFLVDGLIMLVAKAMSMLLCFFMAAVIAPVGLLYLYVHHSRRSG